MYTDRKKNPQNVSFTDWCSLLYKVFSQQLCWGIKILT